MVYCVITWTCLAAAAGQLQFGKKRMRRRLERDFIELKCNALGRSTRKDETCEMRAQSDALC